MEVPIDGLGMRRCDISDCLIRQKAGETAYTRTGPVKVPIDGLGMGRCDVSVFLIQKKPERQLILGRSL